MTRPPGSRRDAALVVGGLATSVFGSSLTTIAVLLATSRHGSIAVSAALISELAPVVLGAPLTGRLADQVSNRLLMFIGLVLQLVAVATLAFTLDTLVAVYVLLFVLGCGAALTGPAAAALVPTVAGEERATWLYARLTMARTLGTMAGWALGGILVQALGARTALLIDASTFAAYAGAILLLSADRIPRPAGSEGAAPAGFTTFREIPVLGIATLGFTLMILATVIVNVAEVFFVTGPLGVGAAWLGVISACWMAGSFVGARLVRRLATGRQLLVCLGVGGAAIAFGLFLAGVAVTLPTTVVGWFVGGAGNGIQNVCQSSLVRLLVPDHQRGRVFAAVGALAQGGNIVGTAAAAPVVGALGSRDSLVLAGTVSAVPAAAVLAAAAHMRRRASGSAAPSADQDG